MALEPCFQLAFQFSPPTREFADHEDSSYVRRYPGYFSRRQGGRTLLAMERRTLIAGTLSLAITGGIPDMPGGFFNSTERSLAVIRDDLKNWDTSTPNKVPPAVALELAQEKTVHARHPYGLYPVAGEIAALTGYQFFDLGDTLRANAALAFAGDCAARMRGIEGLSLATRINVSKVRLLVHNGQVCNPVEQRRWIGEAIRTSIHDDVRLTNYERALIHRAQARALSNSGDVRATMGAIARAEQLYDQAVSHPQEVPSWVWQDGVPEHTGDINQSLADLALAGDPTTAQMALDGLLTAARSDTAHIRTQLFSLLTSASLCIQHLDRDQGLELAREARALWNAHDVHSAQADHMWEQLRARALAASWSGEDELFALACWG